MAAAAPLYDLVLLLDSTADDDRRAQILRGVEDAIGKGGEVVNKQDWGMRSLAFEIRHKKDADYHLLQFHGAPELLAQIDRSLRITDEVVRFRIIKLAPGTPPPPEHRSEPRPAGASADEVPVAVGGPPAESEAEAEEAAPATGETAVAEAAPAAEPATDAPATDTPAEAEAPEEAAAPEAAAPETPAPEADAAEAAAAPAAPSGDDEPAQ